MQHEIGEDKMARVTIEGKKKLSVNKRTIDMAIKGSLGHIEGNETIDDHHTNIVMSTKSLIDQGNLLEKSRRTSEPVEKCKRLLHTLAARSSRRSTEYKHLMLAMKKTEDSSSLYQNLPVSCYHCRLQRLQSLFVWNQIHDLFNPKAVSKDIGRYPAKVVSAPEQNSLLITSRSISRRNSCFVQESLKESYHKKTEKDTSNPTRVSTKNCGLAVSGRKQFDDSPANDVRRSAASFAIEAEKVIGFDLSERCVRKTSTDISRVAHSKTIYRGKDSNVRKCSQWKTPQAKGAIETPARKKDSTKMESHGSPTSFSCTDELRERHASSNQRSILKMDGSSMSSNDVYTSHPGTKKVNRQHDDANDGVMVLEELPSIPRGTKESITNERTHETKSCLPATSNSRCKTKNSSSSRLTNIRSNNNSNNGSSILNHCSICLMEFPLNWSQKARNVHVSSCIPMELFMEDDADDEIIQLEIS
ncbi:uncharacterized protein LOC135683042 isoform X2 [Rhopilema esculentum]|uniref:uncharacterized protein LOC135683042 isoform X2 n=1 Tax=Rhopilema esculentum TaxID=499914 RepID=UPI0031E2A07F